MAYQYVLMLYYNHKIGKPVKKELERVLKNHMSGLVRPPAMAFGDVTEKMATLNLQHYEVKFNK